MDCIICGDRPSVRVGMCKRCYEKEWCKKNPDKVRKRYLKYYKKNAEKLREIARNNQYKKGAVPMSENKNCSSFLGCHVAERVLSHVFNNVVKMPPTHPGYDFICNKGKMIDVKSACLLTSGSGNPRWRFKINYNKIADYFLCLAFDNRDNLTLMHIWLIPAFDVNNKSSISMTPISSRMDQYKLEIDKVIVCCNELITQKRS